jgi:hypothetical protein
VVVARERPFNVSRLWKQKMIAEGVHKGSTEFKVRDVLERVRPLP